MAVKQKKNTYKILYDNQNNRCVTQNIIINYKTKKYKTSK